MTKQRTTIDFSKHEFTMEINDQMSVYELKKPGTNVDRVTMINVRGLLVVTGDFGNWIFCREFHPKKGEFVSDSYWCEKAEINSMQKVYDFDGDQTTKELQDMINGKLEEIGFDDEELQAAKDYFEGLIPFADDEFQYITRAYNDLPGFMDIDYVVHAKMINCRLQIIFDAFDEMCNRVPE